MARMKTSHDDKPVDGHPAEREKGSINIVEVRLNLRQKGGDLLKANFRLSWAFVPGGISPQDLPFAIRKIP